MYGTRTAADGWQEGYSTMLTKHGFKQGRACPNLFHHPERHIFTAVHGDDFTSTGPKSALDWLEKSLLSEYELSIGPRLGPGPADDKEGRALNRVVRWTQDGLEYEADPRQIEKLVLDCGLEGANQMSTPSVKVSFNDLEQDTPLQPEMHTAFRGAAARSNYVSADRLDAQFSCKEVCRSMAQPTEESFRAIKRLFR